MVPGALLLMDGQAMGTLPLQVNINVPAGTHRFTLQQGPYPRQVTRSAFLGVDRPS